MSGVLALAGLALACRTDGPGPPVALVLADRQVTGRVTETVPVVVRVLDAADRSVPGVSVQGMVAAGRLDVTQAVSDGEGLARFAWTLDTVAGMQALLARIGEDGPAHELPVTVLPGPAATGRFTDAQAVATGGMRLTLPFLVWDRWGNAVSDPPIVSTDPAVTVDSGRWTPLAMRGARFVLDLPVSDTVDAYVHPPSGAYRAQFRVADTVWVETGTLAADTSDPALVCPVSATAIAVRVYGAFDVTRIRRVAGWADTARAAARLGAIIHVIEPTVDPTANQTMRYRPFGIDTASSCGGTQFVRPWRYALLPNLADSLVIVPD